MSVRMIILLGIFVWAPMMGFLAFKYFQTFTQRAQAVQRRVRRPMIANGGVRDDSNKVRHRVYRKF